MKKIYNLLIFAYLFISCEQKADMTSIRAGIDRSNQAFMDAVTNKDPDAAVQVYTENVTVMPANSPVINGREEAKRFFAGAINAGISGLKIITTEVNGAGDMAVEAGKYQMMVGDNVVDEGKYIVEWKKVGDQWLINKDMFSTNNPAPRATSTKDQTVGIAVFKVKKGMNQKYEDFVRNILMPSADRSTPAGDQSVRAVRFLAPGAPEKDGSFRYIFIFDPMVKEAEYSIPKILKAKHGEVKGEQLWKEYQSLYNGYEYYEAKQTEI